MLPDAWTYRRVADHPHPVDQTVQTGPFGAQLHADDYVDEGVPFILIRNIKNSRVDPSGIPKIGYADAARLGNYALQKGDIVFSRVGRVGSCFLAETEHVGWIISGQLLRMRLDMTDLDPRFLIHWIASPYVERHILGESVGTTRQSINSSILASMPIPAIPAAEQSAIAEILDTLDNTIRQTEAIIEKLKQVKQGLLHDLLTRGIDANGELRPPQSQAPHLYKDSPLGWIPREWRLGPIESFLDRIIDYRGKTPAKTSSGVPLITAKNVRLGYVDPEPHEFIDPGSFDRWMTRGIPKRGDVLFTTEAPLGNVAQIESDDQLAFAQRMIILQANSTTDSTFLKFMMLGDSFRTRLFAMGSGSTVEGIQQSTFRRLLIAVPSSKHEQQGIVERLVSIDGRRGQELALLVKSNQTKSGLMDDLLTGRVRVTPLLAPSAP